MAPKRHNESQSADEPSAHERKKQKTATARTIAVQPETGPSTLETPPGAGPSRSVRLDSERSIERVAVTVVSCRSSWRYERASRRAGRGEIRRGECTQLL